MVIFLQSIHFAVTTQLLVHLMCYSVQLIIHFASGKALGEIASSWSGGCRLAEGQGEGTVCRSRLMTHTPGCGSLWLTVAQTETPKAVGQRGTSALCKRRSSHEVDGQIRKAAGSFDGVTQIYDLSLVAISPCRSSWLHRDSTVCVHSSSWDC